MPARAQSSRLQICSPFACEAITPPCAPLACATGSPTCTLCLPGQLTPHLLQCVCLIVPDLPNNCLSMPACLWQIHTVHASTLLGSLHTKLGGTFISIAPPSNTHLRDLLCLVRPQLCKQVLVLPQLLQPGATRGDQKRPEMQLAWGTHMQLQCMEATHGRSAWG